MKTQLAQIPFSGFYNSLHDGEIDTTIERMFSDHASGCEVNRPLADRFFDKCDFGAVHRAYAADYAARFGKEFDISLQFESMESPKYYNYTTDRIFVHIEGEEVQRLYAATDKAALAEAAREMFTSCDGFISSYSPDVESWGDVSTWDHNQILCLLRTYANQEHPNGEFDDYAEYSLMEDCFCNGNLDNWLFEAAPNANRLFRIHDYLEHRKGRYD